MPFGAIGTNLDAIGPIESRIFFCPERLHDFFVPEVAQFFGPKRLRDFFCPERLCDLLFSREVA